MEHNQSNFGLAKCHNCGVRRKQLTNPTSNYGFVLPTATDLVTDLPADFEVALQGVDTRLKALQPGTTLGDIAYSSATANTNTRLGIGSTGNVLTVAGGVPTWAAPTSGGKVLQVVMGSTSTTVNNSTSTYTDTGLTATITPASASSKILVLISQGIYKDPNETPSIRLVRAGSVVQRYDANVYVSSTNEMAAYMPIVYLDSPATTSATIYKTTFCSLANSAYVAVQQDFGFGANAFSSIVLMEIGA